MPGYLGSISSVICTRRFFANLKSTNLSGSTKRPQLKDLFPTVLQLVLKLHELEYRILHTSKLFHNDNTNDKSNVFTNYSQIFGSQKDRVNSY